MEHNTTKYKEQIVNALTGEITWRDYTDAEKAVVDAAEVKALEIVEQAEAKKAARAAVLKKLGLTVEEAAALLG